jgi:low temperature requirement protein LtrA
MQVPRPRIRQGTQTAVVTPLELFFDLVFVFAMTQVTAFMAAELSLHGVVRGILVIMLLWWAWTGYAWLANVVSVEHGPSKLVILGAHVGDVRAGAVHPGGLRGCTGAGCADR